MGVLTLLQRCSRCILQPQPTEQRFLGTVPSSLITIGTSVTFIFSIKGLVFVQFFAFFYRHSVIC